MRPKFGVIDSGLILEKVAGENKLDILIRNLKKNCVFSGFLSLIDPEIFLI
jgi:hypothetical protein